MDIYSNSWGCTHIIDEPDFQLGMKRLENILRKNRSDVSESKSDGSTMNVCAVCNHVWKSRGGRTPKLCPACRSAHWNSQDMIENCCLRCGHKWTTSSKDAVRCPKCKSKKWNQKRVTLVCRKCGNRWDDRLLAGEDVVCPRCGKLAKGEYRSAYKERITLKNIAIPDDECCLDELVLKEMWSESDIITRSLILRNHGLTSEQADVLVSFDSGTGIPTIACKMSMSVSEVMRIVLPYMDLCESMGAKTWT